MRKVYVAGSFYKENDSLKNDFRVKLLGSEDILWNENEEAKVEIFHETMKYVGPFFYYPEKEKEFKKIGMTEQETVVALEKRAIESCDLFVSYFGTKSSPGTVAELIYAVEYGKDIFLFYLKTENNRWLKSEYWFPILMAKEISNKNDSKFIMREVISAREYLNFLREGNISYGRL